MNTVLPFVLRRCLGSGTAAIVPEFPFRKAAFAMTQAVDGGNKEVLMRNRLLATVLAATAAVLLAATPAPAQVNAGINARAKVGTSVGSMHMGARHRTGI